MKHCLQNPENTNTKVFGFLNAKYSCYGTLQFLKIKLYKHLAEMA